jgi:hypothetical protein
LDALSRDVAKNSDFSFSGVKKTLSPKSEVFRLRGFMLTVVIWVAGVVLEFVVLFRGWRAKLLTRYPFFYAYNVSVLAASLLAYAFYTKNLQWYRHYFYWGADLLTLTIGYGIVLEIFKHVLGPFPGAHAFARIAGLVVFGCILGFSAILSSLSSRSSALETALVFERNLRAVQAIFLFGILAVISYYRIQMGKNMKGMVAGYGLYIGISLISLALGTYAPRPFDAIAEILQPLSYDASLLVWSATLWGYHPNPVPQSDVGLEADYEGLAARTRTIFGTLRSFLGKAARP